MLAESFLSMFWASSQRYTLDDTLLFPENGDGPTQHSVTQHYILSLNQLFSFHKVSHVSIVINASRVKPRAHPQVTPARDQAEG